MPGILVLTQELPSASAAQDSCRRLRKILIAQTGELFPQGMMIIRLSMYT